MLVLKEKGTFDSVNNESFLFFSFLLFLVSRSCCAPSSMFTLFMRPLSNLHNYPLRLELLFSAFLYTQGN